MVTGWVPSAQVPLAFGGPLICGWDGDTWTGDVPLALFGAGSLSMLFNLPSAQTSIKVAVTAKQVGAPTAPLVLTLYSPTGAVIGSVSVPAASVPTAAPNWIPFQTFSGTLAPGYYKLVVTSPASTSTAYYRVFISFNTSWWDPKAKGNFTPPPGFGGNSGASVVWVQDAAGNDITVLPFGDVLIPAFSTKFVAEGNYPISALCPWLSDMPFQFKPYSVSWVLQDLTAGTALGSSQASQAYNSHGIFGLVPFQLPAPVNLVLGHTYQVSISGALSYLYGVLLRGNSINPVKAAPGGVTPYWWGEVAYADFSAYRVLDYVNNHILAPDGIGTFAGQGRVGVRFVAPAAGGTLSSVQLKMYSNSGGNYPAGTAVTVSIYASNDAAGNSAGSQPSGAPLASMMVDSGSIPANGWFSVSGFSFQMQANTPYWIVWSAPAAVSGYGPQRNVSPFRHLSQVSRDGGVTWIYPGQGPTDLAWYGLLSSGAFVGSPYESSPALAIGSTSFVAQPFILPKAASLGSFFLVPTGSPGVVKVAVYPDNGAGTGPNMAAAPLGSGTFDTALQYQYSGIIIPFDTSPASLQANTKYWAVISSASGGKVIAASYWTRPVDPAVPLGYEVLVSSNGGASWGPASAQVTSLVFMVGVQPSGPGPTPTILKLKAVVQ